MLDGVVLRIEDTVAVCCVQRHSASRKAHHWAKLRNKDDALLPVVAVYHARGLHRREIAGAQSVTSEQMA